MPEGIQVASVPRCAVGLLIPLLQNVIVSQCNSEFESTGVLILHILKIIELMNIGMLKESNKCCYQDSGLPLK